MLKLELGENELFVNFNDIKVCKKEDKGFKTCFALYIYRPKIYEMMKNQVSVQCFSLILS